MVLRVGIRPNPNLTSTTLSEVWCPLTPFTQKTMSMSDQWAGGEVSHLICHLKSHTQENSRQLPMEEREERNCRMHTKQGGEEQPAGGVTPGCMQCWSMCVRVCVCGAGGVKYSNIKFNFTTHLISTIHNQVVLKVYVHVYVLIFGQQFLNISSSLTLFLKCHLANPFLLYGSLCS